jgi:hypothetical protein
MLVLENVIRDSVTYTEHAKRKTGMSILLDLTLPSPSPPSCCCNLACKPPPPQKAWHPAPISLIHLLTILGTSVNANNSNIPRCRLRPQATGKDPLRIRRLVPYPIHPWFRSCSPLLYLVICCSPRIFNGSWELNVYLFIPVPR